MRGNVRKLSLVLAVMVLLMVLFTGCSSTEPEDSVSPAADATPDGSGENVDADNELDPYELVLAYPVLGNIPPDIDLVEAGINEITQEEINATVKLLPISYGTWAQQMNLMMSGGEKLDILVSLGDYMTRALSGQLLDITGLMDEYGQGAIEAVGKDRVDVGLVKGSLYGVPTLHDYGNGYGVLVRKDIAEKYNIDVASIKTLEDVGNALKTVKENEPDITPLALNNRSMMPPTYVGVDSLGDTSFCGVLPNDAEDFTVVNIYEMPEYKAILETLHSWFEAGYINQDAATYQGNTNDFLKSDRAYFDFTTTKPGMAESANVQVGKEMVLADLRPGMSATGNITSIMWCLAHQSDNPERAMMFINEVYTNKDLVNLFIWGIEGEHYVKVSDNVVDYPEGVDVANTGYNNSETSWLFGNQFLSYTFEGTDPDVWEKTREWNDQAEKSRAMGFTFDPENVRTELATLNNVVNEYAPGLYTGSLDPDEALPEFQQKLKASGIDKVIAEKQAQLDEWVAAQE